MASFLWLIPGFPFISAAVLALFGPRIPRRMAAWIGTSSVGLSAITAIVTAIGFLQSPPSGGAWVRHLWTWMSIGDFQPEIALYFDPVTVVMVSVITFVGFLIHFIRLNTCATTKDSQDSLRI